MAHAFAPHVGTASDAQDGTDARPLSPDDDSAQRQGARRGGKGRGKGRGRRRGGPAEWAADGGMDLDIEDHGACWQSMNIGIMFFPPGKRPGTLRLMEESTTHLSQENNLHRVDQGPLNYRWKHGAGNWKWKSQLHPVADRSGKRLCGLVNGSVVGAVLPSAQFCNTLTHSVLSLWRVHGVAPFVVHATWMSAERDLEPRSGGEQSGRAPRCPLLAHAPRPSSYPGAGDSSASSSS